jgi:thiamine transporter ThiT
MFAFLKSIVLGAALAFILSLFIGSGGATGGPLNVRSYTIEEVQFFWSWPLFGIGTGLSFGILLLMD